MAFSVLLRYCLHENHERTIGENQKIFALLTREWEHELSPSGECDLAYHRKRLWMKALSKSYENWHTVYIRINRWNKNGVLQRFFEELQRENIIKLK